MLKHFIYICMGAGLLACSSVTTIHTNAERVEVTDAYEHVNKIDSIVQPFKEKLEEEMLVVIAHASKDFKKGRPNGALNNWAADVTLNSQRDTTDIVPTFCLLNVGGLRNPISKGDVTIGDLYKLMPFDNEVVVVELPWKSLEKIQTYLIERDGEPIAGAKLVDGNLRIDQLIVGEINIDDESSAVAQRIVIDPPETFRVVTSDYLMNGGDNMDFFKDKLNVEHTGQLLRDVMIEQAKQQGELIWSDEERITL